ncbi:hypothetical protein GWI33_011634 [Rhynchophorus ferrugineus]|uniref:Uncharacterized protein n=1 Tax=Rhynchophorus ferrugineus TaxID=354439 RepID=A0A834I6N7_RHYFE|nr:hypothetical protein GWI33_011634 [Rhynchophorus ferrugineus]
MGKRRSTAKALRWLAAMRHVEPRLHLIARAEELRRRLGCRTVGSPVADDPHLVQSARSGRSGIYWPACGDCPRETPR